MEECKAIRKRIIELSYSAGKNGSHLGGSLSAVEILYSLYTSCFDFNPNKLDRDRFILSKGHGALALYCVLEQVGVMTKDEVDGFEHNATNFFAHAKKDIKKGVEFSGGSLSLGLSYAIGVALGCKSKGYANHVFVLVGDGECNEGLVWESVMSAVNYKLDNLVIIVDKNGLQSDGFTKDIMDCSPITNRFDGFGCETVEIDGHNIEEIKSACNKPHENRPLIIIANTIKGKGVSFMEDNISWHHGVLTSSLYQKAIEEIDNGTF